MLCKFTHCTECVSANTRPHQLHWSSLKWGLLSHQLQNSLSPIVLFYMIKYKIYYRILEQATHSFFFCWYVLCTGDHSVEREA